jgi:hypothetical protein
MASRLIGRAPCPECGFKSAHVKQSEKCLYRHCPDCGAQYMATGEARAAALMAKTTVTATGPSPSASADALPADKAPAATHTAPEPAPAPAPAPKRSALFGL